MEGEYDIIGSIHGRDVTERHHTAGPPIQHPVRSARSSATVAGSSFGPLLGLVWLVSIAACAPEPSELDDPRTDGPTPELWAEGEAWHLGVEILEIGELAGADVYHFVDVAAGARLENGDLVVADAGSRRVRWYDADGRYLRDLGAPGEGPGEFRSPAQVSIGGDGQIVIWDAGHWRLSRFDARGDHVGDDDGGVAAFMRVAAPPLYPTSARTLGNGEWVVRLDAKAGASPKEAAADKGAEAPSPAAGGEVHEAGVVRASASWAMRLLWTTAGEEQVIVDAPWGPQPMPPPLARDLRIAVQPGGDWFCVGDQREPRVRCSGPDAAERTIEWTAAPLTVGATERDIARWREDTEATYGQKLAVDEVRRLMAQVAIPTARPPHAEIHLDAGAHLWVERGPAPDGDGVDYLVFDPGGRLLGHVVLPDVRILEVGMDYILGVRRDALGVQYLQLLPLTKPS